MFFYDDDFSNNQNGPDLPQYLDYFCILGLLGVTVVTRISYLVKMFIIISLVITQCGLNLTILSQSFRNYDMNFYIDIRLPYIGHELYLSLILITIAIVLFLINRQVMR